MSNQHTTLNEFFSLKEVKKDQLSEIESKSKVATLKERIKEKAKEIDWPAAFEAIIKKAEDLLDIEIPDIMIGAWKKYAELAKYTDAEEYPPDETYLVPLAEHTITSNHKPHIDILVNDHKLGSINFSIDLSLALKGFVLKIQAAKITEILTGSCQAKGSLKCEDFTLLEKQSEPLSLPVSIILKTPISIPT